MADTVKKSRIVSEEDKDMEAALLEEFNIRLKKCMSNDDLQKGAEPPEPDEIYESLSVDSRVSPIEASQTFIRVEVEENYYEEPSDVGTQENGHHHVDNDDDDENIYENIPEKTEQPDQNDVEVRQLRIEEYEAIGQDHYEDLDKPRFALPTTCLTDYSESKSPDSDGKASAKNRMLLCTDDTSTLLFTQTVTSPMLTPSEENIDFLKGFQREVANSESTISTTPPKDDEKLDRTDSGDSLDPSEEEKPPGEENFYENASFFKNTTPENMYENLRPDEGAGEALAREDNIYDNLEFNKGENIYQTVEECFGGDRKSAETDEGSLEEFIRNERESCAGFAKTKDSRQSSPSTENLHPETMSEPPGKVEEASSDANETRCDAAENPEVLISAVESEEDLLGCKTSKIITRSETVVTKTNKEKSIETYSEMIYHTRSETGSNYCEKYTEVLLKNSKNEIGNREKDTETVPAEIVKNLKSQLWNKSGAEVVGITKKEGVKEMKATVNIIDQIKKFEHSDDDKAEDSTEYSETIMESNSPGEMIIKKKKTKKTRKEEKENISVTDNGFVEGENFYNVNVKTLKSSFSKFDALQKKNVLHIRSSDSAKAQEKFNGAQVDVTNCKACGKQVFQMEQIKAEKAIWHKNCFRCTECNKQLTVDTYESNEGSLYCKPHFKALFAPKAVEEDTPPSDKPDLGLEELQSLNVKERFQVFEHYQNETNQTEAERGSVNVKRSPSILSKLAKFQKHGMDVGVSNEALDGIPVEESSSEEEEEEIPEGDDPDLVRAKRVQKEKPFHFTGMSDVKKKWESGDQSKEERREERKQEIQSIRNKLFMGKQEKMKEAYQQAVMESESSTNLRKNLSEKIEICDTKSIKERFEKGELTNDKTNRERNNDEEEVYESEISKKSRSLFLELDASASKPPQVSPATPPKLEVKKARETETPEREIYRDPEVIRSEEIVDDSVIAKETHTASKMLNKFRQMEENLQREPESAGPKPLKRFTPPLEPAKPESNSEEESGSEYEEEEEDEEVDHCRLPEDVMEAQKAARARQLRAKFEKWEANEIKKEQQNMVNVVEEYGEEQSQIESTRVLRARFESIQQSSADKSRAPRVKPGRFV